jgi:hypothetical protein
VLERACVRLVMYSLRCFVVTVPWVYRPPPLVMCHEQLKGLTPAVTRHDNDVVAMTWLDIPTRLLVTGGKDGLVKVWR